MRRYFLIAVIIRAIAFGVGAGIALLTNPQLLSGQDKTLPQRVSTLPEFSFTDLEDRERHSSEWSGHVLVLNFWATWCPPCRAEIPGFIKLQEKYAGNQVQFVGIAVDEKDLVAEFAKNMGINYPLLLGELDAVKLSELMGNRFGGLPYTVVIDREGSIRHRQPGEMREDELESIITGLL